MHRITKNLLGVLLAILVIGTLFAACHAKETADPTNASQEIGTAKTSFTILENGKSEYQVVSYFSFSDKERDAFLNRLKMKIGIDLPYSTDTSYVGGKQIVLARSADIPQIDGTSTRKSWTSASLLTNDETVYLIFDTRQTLDKAATLLLRNLKKVDAGDVVMANGLHIVEDISKIDTVIPNFVSETGKFAEVLNCVENNYRAIYQEVGDKAEIEAYLALLEENGFEPYFENPTKQGLFVTYTKENTLVHISWRKNSQQLSVLYGQKGFMPENKPITDYKTVVQPVMAQLPSDGLGLVVQLPDGTFVIVDGGHAHDIPKQTLWDFLRQRTPAGEKPQIIWLLTHIHNDHINLAKEFWPEHKDDIEIKYVGMNMPDFMNISVENEGTKLGAYAILYGKMKDLLATNYPGTPIYTYHTGQAFYVPGGSIEILATPEDSVTNAFSWINDTSGIYKITVMDKSMLVFGDATPAAVEPMWQAFEPARLKADIIQMPHHGSSAQSIELYKAVDPDICFWSCSEEVFYNNFDQLGKKPAMVCNKWIREDTGTDGQRSRQHYHLGKITVVDVPSLSVQTFDYQ